MRVISGKSRGKRLETLSGGLVRPTTDKVKESIFNIIQFDLQDKSFLDLFSGSGQMGIEAISRGAKEAIFVDKSKRSIEVVKRNLKSVGLCSQALVINSDYRSFLEKTNFNFDIAFLDPPYGTGILQKALDVVINVMNRDGIIICENEVNENLPSLIKNFYCTKKYKYGKIAVSIYKGGSNLA